jgi:hypothetical protein
MDPLDAYNASVNRRLSIAAFLTVALMTGTGAILACSAAQVPDRAERVRLGAEALTIACSNATAVQLGPELEALCEFVLGDSTASSLPPVASGEPPDGGPGQGVRSVGDGGT